MFTQELLCTMCTCTAISILLGASVKKKNPCLGYFSAQWVNGIVAQDSMQNPLIWTVENVCINFDNQPCASAWCASALCISLVCISFVHQLCASAWCASAWCASARCASVLCISFMHQPGVHQLGVRAWRDVCSFELVPTPGGTWSTTNCYLPGLGYTNTKNKKTKNMNAKRQRQIHKWTSINTQ